MAPPVPAVSARCLVTSDPVGEGGRSWLDLLVMESRPEAEYLVHATDCPRAMRGDVSQSEEGMGQSDQSEARRFALN